MKGIPSNVSPYKRTPEFSEESVPAGLLNDHSTKEGVWGKIVVLEGLLEYTIQEPVQEKVELSAERYGVIEPKIKHHIKPLGSVRFFVEFYR